MKALLLLVLVVLCGCSDGGPGRPQMRIPLVRQEYEISVDPTFSPVALGGILMALEEWKAVACDTIRFSVTIERKLGEPRAGELYILKKQPADSDGLALVSDDGTKAQIWMDGVQDDRYHKLALHEFGHVLGLDHYEGEEPSIMRPRVRVDFITPRDIQDLHHIRPCSCW